VVPTKKSPSKIVDIRRFEEEAEEQGYELNEDDIAYLEESAGVILESTSRGFVRGSWYEEKELDNVWDEIVEELEEERQPNIIELTYDENTDLVYDDSGRMVWPHTPTYTEWSRFEREHLDKYGDPYVVLHIVNELGVKSTHPLEDREIEDLLAA
jgi:hypothetical protein